MVASQSVPDTDHHRTFVFTFNSGQNQDKRTLRLSINIAESQNCEELAARVCEHHDIPCFVEKELKEEIQKFVECERAKVADEAASSLIKKFKENPDAVSDIATKVTDKYRKTWARFTETEDLDKRDAFDTMYHKLIHSKVMTLLLSIEENYYHDVQKLISDRVSSMKRLSERQELEMQRACEHAAGSLYTESDVNNIAAKHSCDSERLLGDWNGKYTKLVQTQRKEYRDVVKRLYGEMMANNGEVDEHGPTYVEFKKVIDVSARANAMKLSSLSDLDNPNPYESSPSRRFQQKDSLPNPEFKQGATESPDSASLHEEFVPHFEESFTINLGAQMKTMHNIRLVAAPILHFCRHSNQSGDLQAQRLQTVLSLYSNSLSGIVLLVDGSIASISALKSNFSSVCESSTEFHFPTYNEQVEEIKHRKSAALDQASVKSGDSLSTGSGSGGKSSGDSDFQDGDFYVTKHSNLSKVHIVFHLVANASNLKSPESSTTVSSRHPVILGLRHILKVMSSHDVSTLMIPLLLCHELLDNVDDAWIVKRAELVMKCMKGFMMEMAAWDGGISRTIQFVLPPGISEGTFYRLSSMLPEIFRTTSARNLTTNTPKKTPASPRNGRR